MSSYRSLAEFVGERADRHQIRWRELMGQFDESKRKLGQLRQYADRYRLQMGDRLTEGLDAAATMGFIRFIGQIESVIGKQESEVTRLEQICHEQWENLVEARREKRMYEILRDKQVAEKMAAELQRGQRELDELMGRIVKLL